MSLVLRKDTYIDWHVYSVTKIKDKYGFRIMLVYSEMDKVVQQKSGFKTIREADECRNQIIAQLTNHTYVVYPKVKVKDYFDYWLNEVMFATLQYNSYMSYRNAINNYIVKKYGELYMSTLNQAHIQRLYKEIISKHESVARLVKVVMKDGLDYAVKVNILSTNVASDVNLPKMTKSTKYRTLNIDSSKTYTITQVKKLLEHSKDSPIHLEVMFAVLMGMRISEIIGLKYSDIDYVNRKLHTERQLGKLLQKKNSDLKRKTTTKQEKQLKTVSSNRWIDIPDVLFEEILEQRKKYEKNKSRRINDKSNPFLDDNYICCSTYGHSRTRNHHYEHYRKIIDNAGLPYIRFHDLRHTFTTILIKANFSSKAISQLLGHSSEIITVDVYTDKQAVINDCLNVLEPYILEVVPSEKTKGQVYDCTDIVIDDVLYLGNDDTN